ncbi:MAG: F0F1 ATP synthase subunit delta [Candidatus Omnitrophota bacterium]
MLFISLLIIQVVIFVGLVVLLRNMLTKNITGATAHLDQLNRDYTKKQEEANKKLQEADQYYQQTIAKAREEALQFKERLEKEAQTGKDKTLELARQESERLIERANKTRELLIDEIEQKIEERALGRAADLVEQVLPRHLYKDIHAHWVEVLISSGLEELGSLQLPRDVAEVQLKSAFQLTAAQKESLSLKLKEKLSREITLKEEVDPHVVAGVIITLGSLVLDGSLRKKIRESARVQSARDK